MEQLDIFELMKQQEKIDSLILWSKTKLNTEYWDKSAKDYKYFFNIYPLHYISLPEEHGITLIMFNSTPMSSKTYSFEGFIYNNEHYYFHKDYRNWSEVKYEQYWYQLVYWYNSIYVSGIDKIIRKYICKKIKQKLKEVSNETN